MNMLSVQAILMKETGELPASGDDTKINNSSSSSSVAIELHVRSASVVLTSTRVGGEFKYLPLS